MIPVLRQIGEAPAPFIDVIAAADFFGRYRSTILIRCGLSVSKQTYSDSLGSYAVSVAVVIPDLCAFDTDLLGLVAVRDRIGIVVDILAVLRFFAFQRLEDHVFLDGVYDLNTMIPVLRQIVEAPAPFIDVIAAADYFGRYLSTLLILGEISVCIQLYSDARGSYAVPVAVVIPDLLAFNTDQFRLTMVRKRITIFSAVGSIRFRIVAVSGSRQLFRHHFFDSVVNDLTCGVVLAEILELPRPVIFGIVAAYYLLYHNSITIHIGNNIIVGVGSQQLYSNRRRALAILVITVIPMLRTRNLNRHLRDRVLEVYTVCRLGSYRFIVSRNFLFLHGVYELMTIQCTRVVRNVSYRILRQISEAVIGIAVYQLLSSNRGVLCTFAIVIITIQVDGDRRMRRSFRINPRLRTTDRHILLINSIGNLDSACGSGVVRGREAAYCCTTRILDFYFNNRVVGLFVVDVLGQILEGILPVVALVQFGSKGGQSISAEARDFLTIVQYTNSDLPIILCAGCAVDPFLIYLNTDSLKAVGNSEAIVVAAVFRLESGYTLFNDGVFNFVEFIVILRKLLNSACPVAVLIRRDGDGLAVSVIVRGVLVVRRYRDGFRTTIAPQLVIAPGLGDRDINVRTVGNELVGTGSDNLKLFIRRSFARRSEGEAILIIALKVSGRRLGFYNPVDYLVLVLMRDLQYTVRIGSIRTENRPTISIIHVKGELRASKTGVDILAFMLVENNLVSDSSTTGRCLKLLSNRRILIDTVLNTIHGEGIHKRNLRVGLSRAANVDLVLVYKFQRLAVRQVHVKTYLIGIIDQNLFKADGFTGTVSAGVQFIQLDGIRNNNRSHRITARRCPLHAVLRFQLAFFVFKQIHSIRVDLNRIFNYIEHLFRINLGTALVAYYCLGYPNLNSIRIAALIIPFSIL